MIAPSAEGSAMGVLFQRPGASDGTVRQCSQPVRPSAQDALDLDAVHTCLRPCISPVIRACRAMTNQYEAEGADKAITSAIDTHVPCRADEARRRLGGAGSRRTPTFRMRSAERVARRDWAVRVLAYQVEVVR